ncbi:hypothetical protein NST21_05525 [Peribacillus sp. FSL K6-1552]|uniref:hypothetical protein n=1 Tax=Peribacillus sp. FSL K6-1552 TaxID=2954514 RepID=UPI0030F65901
MADTIAQLLPILFMLLFAVILIFLVINLSQHFNRSKRIEEKLDKLLKEIANNKGD